MEMPKGLSLNDNVFINITAVLMAFKLNFQGIQM